MNAFYYPDPITYGNRLKIALFQRCYEFAPGGQSLWRRMPRTKRSPSEIRELNSTGLLRAFSGS